MSKRTVRIENENDRENHPVSVVGDTDRTGGRERRAIMTGAITGNTLISCHRHREVGREREGELAGRRGVCAESRSARMTAGTFSLPEINAPR